MYTVCNIEDIKKSGGKHIRDQQHHRIQIRASIYCILSVCLSCQLSVRGLTSPFVPPTHDPWTPLSVPHHGSTTDHNPSKNTDVSEILISMHVCIYCVYLPCCGPCLSPCLKWHHWTKRGSVSGGGGLSLGCRDNSIIPPLGERTGGLSLRKAFKTEKKIKSWGFRKQSLMGK